MNPISLSVSEDGFYVITNNGDVVHYAGAPMGIGPMPPPLSPRQTRVSKVRPGDRFEDHCAPYVAPPVSDEPDFEMRTLDGRRMAIWADGRIEGFPAEYTIMINRLRHWHDRMTREEQD